MRDLHDENERHLREAEQSGRGTPLPNMFVHLKAESEKGVVTYEGILVDAFATAAGGPSYLILRSCTRSWLPAKTEDNRSFHGLTLIQGDNIAALGVALRKSTSPTKEERQKLDEALRGEASNPGPGSRAHNT